MVIHAAAEKGRTLLVPFFIGPKYSHMMSLTNFVDRRFENIDLIYNVGDSINKIGFINKKIYL